MIAEAETYRWRDRQEDRVKGRPTIGGRQTDRKIYR